MALILQPRPRIVGGSFVPADLIGVVSSWFRVSRGTIEGSGYSVIPDQLDAANPATQATDARRPPAALSANGLPILQCLTAYMSAAITAARTNVTTWGYWGWLRPAATSDSPMTLAIGGGANVNRTFLWFNTSAQRLQFRVFTATGHRHAEVLGLSADTWRFYTVEYNGNLVGDARCAITIDGVVQTPIFSSGGAGVTEMPPTLMAVTGTISLFSAFAAAGPYFVGQHGPNFGYLAGAMAGATEGLLTPQARAQLRNFEAPTS
jgi:hypothetical protein